MDMNVLERDYCTRLNALHLIGPGHRLYIEYRPKIKLPPADHEDNSSNVLTTGPGMHHRVGNKEDRNLFTLVC